MIKTYKNALKEIVQRNSLENSFQYVFLLGAGTSIASGIPDGKALCKNLLEEYPSISTKHIDKEQKKSGINSYQATLRVLSNYCNDFLIAEKIRQIISRARRPSPDNRWIINNCYDCLAAIMIEKPHFSRMALTTNFDPLLYYAFIQNWHTEPILVRAPEEYETMNPMKFIESFPALLFIHGYWQNYRLFNGTGENKNWLDLWLPKLNKIEEQDVIVLGYSGLEDSIAVSWMKKILKDVGTRKIWWSIYSPSLKTEPSIFFINQICKNLEVEYGSEKIIYFPIEDAETFMVDLGAYLSIEKARKLKCMRSIFPWFSPSSADQFANGATIEYKTDGKLEVFIKTVENTQPGNNHAGIWIETVKYQINLSKFKIIRIYYTVDCKPKISKTGGFEFKLHSNNGKAWAYFVPFNIKSKFFDIPLSEYLKNGVDLNQIWRIVIAADVNALGINGKMNVSILKVELIS